MKSLKIMVLSLAATTVAGTVIAADLPSTGFELSDLRPSVEEASHGSWTGAYVGGNIGSSWNSSRDRYTKDNAPPVPNVSLVNNQNRDASFIGGVQAGYNYQADELVYGVEVDISFAARNSGWKTSVSDPFAYSNPPEQSFLRSKSNLNWFSTLRGRLGYALSDEFMIYGTAGVAVGQVNVRSQEGVTTSPTLLPEATWTNSKSFTRLGWAAGFGAEYALTENLSLKGEYLRVDLGSNTFALPSGAYMRNRAKSDIARMGINYRFQ